MGIPGGGSIAEKKSKRTILVYRITDCIKNNTTLVVVECSKGVSPHEKSTESDIVKSGRCHFLAISDDCVGVSLKTNSLKFNINS